MSDIFAILHSGKFDLRNDVINFLDGISNALSANSHAENTAAGVDDFAAFVGSLFRRTVDSGDCILLCTDGLSNMLDDQEILFEVAHGQDIEQCCQRLLDIAKKRGAPDNVTSVLVTV